MKQPPSHPDKALPRPKICNSCHIQFLDKVLSMSLIQASYGKVFTITASSELLQLLNGQNQTGNKPKVEALH